MTVFVRRRLEGLGLLLALTLLAACAARPAESEPAAGGPAALRAVATYSILGDMVHHVAGDRVALTTLVPPGGDVHTYEPSPRDNATLAGAALLFENGLAFEGWLDDLYAASGSRAARVVTTAAITPLATPDDEDHVEQGAPNAEHGHAEYDPHVWHDPANAMAMVAAIRDALVQADPAGAAVYRANASAYQAQLRELDSWIKAELARLPDDRRKLVTTHDTFGYFARAYGFTVVGTALGAASTESIDPSAGELAELVQQIRAAAVPAIFAENVANPDLMQTIAQEAGVALAPRLYTDALGEPGGDADSYLAMMRYNVATIVRALAG